MRLFLTYIYSRVLVNIKQMTTNYLYVKSKSKAINIVELRRRMVFTECRGKIFTEIIYGRKTCVETSSEKLPLN